MMRQCTLVLVLVAIFGFSGVASATLYDRGGGLIYDDHLKITWLQDANYAKTSGYDTDGFMTWFAADTWAKNLVYGGYDNWRLPATVDGPFEFGYDGSTTAGYNITSSELGYMYYVNLGNKGYYDTDGNGPQPGWDEHYKNNSFIDGATGETRSFQGYQNLWPMAIWSGTEYLDSSQAWLFFGDGGQGITHKFEYYHTWAVRDGDVSASVPEPATIILFGLGVAALAGVRRKTK